jgi:large subunit ribosomal protein L24e
MHKKGITEEVAKKRSRKTVKHQRGIVGVGADLKSLLEKKNQTEAIRAAARQQAISKAKDEKKAKEAKKAKPKVGYSNQRLHYDDS